MPERTETAEIHNNQTPFDYTLSIIGGKWKMKVERVGKQRYR